MYKMGVRIALEAATSSDEISRIILEELLGEIREHVAANPNLSAIAASIDPTVHTDRLKSALENHITLELNMELLALMSAIKLQKCREKVRELCSSWRSLVTYCRFSLDERHDDDSAEDANPPPIIRIDDIARIMDFTAEFLALTPFREMFYYTSFQNGRLDLSVNIQRMFAFATNILLPWINRALWQQLTTDRLNCRDVCETINFTANVFVSITNELRIVSNEITRSPEIVRNLVIIVDFATDLLCLAAKGHYCSR